MCHTCALDAWGAKGGALGRATPSGRIFGTHNATRAHARDVRVRANTARPHERREALVRHGHPGPVGHCVPATPAPHTSKQRPAGGRLSCGVRRRNRTHRVNNRLQLAMEGDGNRHPHVAHHVAPIQPVVSRHPPPPPLRPRRGAHLYTGHAKSCAKRSTSGPVAMSTSGAPAAAAVANDLRRCRMPA